MKPSKFKFLEKNTIFKSPGIPLIEGRMVDLNPEHTIHDFSEDIRCVHMALVRSMGIPLDYIGEFRGQG